jgi:hypothetical protein
MKEYLTAKIEVQDLKHSTTTLRGNAFIEFSLCGRRILVFISFKRGNDDNS